MRLAPLFALLAGSSVVAATAHGAGVQHLRVRPPRVIFKQRRYRDDGTVVTPLTKNDPSANGTHHFIPVDWVDHVDDKVHLTKSSKEAKELWV